MKSSLELHLKKFIFSLGLAMAFTLIPGVAHANTPVIAVSVNGVAITTASQSATPANVTVPSDNSVDSQDAVRVSITNLTAGSVVSVIANNAFVVGGLSTNLVPVRSSSGVGSLNINTGTGTTAEFYVYTLSTSLSSFTISTSGISNTFYLKGNAGPAYNLESTLPTTGYVSSFGKIALKVTDAFGNAVSGVTPTVSAIGLLSTGAAATDATGSSEITVTYPTSPGRAAIQISIVATSVTGLPAAKSSISAFIDIVSLEAQLLLERAERLKEKQDLQAQLLTAQRAAEAAKSAQAEAEKSEASAKASSESNAAKVAELNRTVSTLNSEIANIRTSLTQANSSLLALDKKYKALVAKYNRAATKYKFAKITG